MNKRCPHCQVLITRRQRESVGDWQKRIFCDRTCAARCTNVRSPKRARKGETKEVSCKKCDSPMTIGRVRGQFSHSRICHKCKEGTNHDPRLAIGLQTKEAFFKKKKNWCSARVAVQRNARKLYIQSGQKLACALCGYEKYVEVAHKKAVSSFSPDTLISVINQLDNLIPLCPNHHWEYDNGFIQLP